MASPSIWMQIMSKYKSSHTAGPMSINLLYTLPDTIGGGSSGFHCSVTSNIEAEPESHFSMKPTISAVLSSFEGGL